MTLQDSIRLVAVQSQGFGELVMRDPVPTVELDEECLLRLPAQVGPVAATLVLTDRSTLVLSCRVSKMRLEEIADESVK